MRFSRWKEVEDWSKTEMFLATVIVTVVVAFVVFVASMGVQVAMGRGYSPEPSIRWGLRSGAQLAMFSLPLVLWVAITAALFLLWRSRQFILNTTRSLGTGKEPLNDQPEPQVDQGKKDQPEASPSTDPLGMGDQLTGKMLELLEGKATQTNDQDEDVKEQTGQPRPKDLVNEPPYKSGQYVLHPRYGLGKIEYLIAVSGDWEVWLDFRNRPQEVLMASVAELRPVHVDEAEVGDEDENWLRIRNFGTMAPYINQAILDAILLEEDEFVLSELGDFVKSAQSDVEIGSLFMSRVANSLGQLSGHPPPQEILHPYLMFGYMESSEFRMFLEDEVPLTRPS